MTFEEACLFDPPVHLFDHNTSHRWLLAVSTSNKRVRKTSVWVHHRLQFAPDGANCAVFCWALIGLWGGFYFRNIDKRFYRSLTPTRLRQLWQSTFAKTTCFGWIGQYNTLWLSVISIGRSLSDSLYNIFLIGQYIVTPTCTDHFRKQVSPNLS